MLQNTIIEVGLTKSAECVKIAMKKDGQKARENYFKAFLFDGALLAGDFGFPQLKPSYGMPKNPLSFVECRTKRRLDNRWLHFFAEDFNFECVWNNPKAYLKLFKRFEGVISPDFSLYGDLPRAYRIWNCYRIRALAWWLQDKGVNILSSVSWTADKADFDWCFDGLPEGGNVAVSANGCYFNQYSRGYFVQGFDAMIERLHPCTVYAVGYLPKELRSRSDVVMLEGYSQQRGGRSHG